VGWVGGLGLGLGCMDVRVLGLGGFMCLGGGQLSWVAAGGVGKGLTLAKQHKAALQQSQG